MSGLALAQENVLSETWVQNLDLTIPSLEMPSKRRRLEEGQTRNYDRVDLLLSERTYQLCPSRAFSEVDRILVKGKSETGYNIHTLN